MFERLPKKRASLTHWSKKENGCRIRRDCDTQRVKREMKIRTVLLCFGLVGMACEPAPDPRVATMAGSWATATKSRTYQFFGDGRFAMTLDSSTCEEQADHEVITTLSGRWRLDGGTLTLIVEQSNNEIFQNATLNEVNVIVEGKKLEFRSCIVLCGADSAERVSLEKQ